MADDIAGAEPAPAKLNLALHVRNRRPDGYHELETLFCFTRFGDALEARAADDWSLVVEGPMGARAGPDADNLVLKAARAFAEKTGSTARYALTLDKRIPVAAGMGGGSADAGATLRLLNRLSGHPLSTQELEEMGTKLGADVPACVRSKSSYGRGIGEELSPGPALSGIPVLLVNPMVAVPTAGVFKAWDGLDRGPLANDWITARNDLQTPAISMVPVIADVLAWLNALPGITMARMSGSGATCFALFADKVPDYVAPSGWWVQDTELL